MSKRININLSATGDGTLECVGLGTYSCLGRAGLAYPRDITITEHDKERLHHSVEFNCDMPFAILIWGQRGIYIHEWPFCQSSGGASAGCIHLCRPNAETVFDWVDQRTRILINY